MWNASHVHKQSIKVWQEKMVDPTWNSVWGMLSTSLLWGRFWCSRTIQIVSKILPDCDISAVKRKFKWTTWRFLGLASSHFWKNWQVRHGDQPWYHKHWTGVFVGTWPIHAPGAPCKHSSNSSRHKTKPSTKQRKFYICADGPHTHPHGNFDREKDEPWSFPKFEWWDKLQETIVIYWFKNTWFPVDFCQTSPLKSRLPHFEKTHISRNWRWRPHHQLPVDIYIFPDLRWYHIIVDLMPIVYLEFRHTVNVQLYDTF